MLYFERIAKDSFDGFVNYFTEKHIKINKFFTAEGSANGAGWGLPQSTLDYSEPSGPSWVSKFDDAVITYTTKCPIYLTHYRLRTRIGTTSQDMPVSWKVEGQMNNETWTLIDTKTNRPELKEVNSSATFKCDTPMSVKKIKITVTKSTCNQYFHLSRTEFFGIMNITQCSFPFHILHICGYTCNSRRTRFNSFFVLVFTMLLC